MLKYYIIALIISQYIMVALKLTLKFISEALYLAVNLFLNL
jgi:hypothetical protein